MSANPLISVIIPCFMQGAYLEEGLESILSQTYHKWECIIINDGSIDNTEFIANQFVSRDNRFKYFYQEHSGVSAARNLGIKFSLGQFILFMDADDLIKSTKFELEIDLIYKNQLPSLIFCAFRYDYMNNRLNKNDASGKFPYFKTSNYLHDLIQYWENIITYPPHCVLINSFIFKNLEIRFNTNLENHVDWDFWISIFKLNPDIVFIDKVLAIYRIHDSNMTKDKRKMKHGFLKAIKLNLNKFENTSVEYILLKKKFNSVKYGINTKYTFVGLIAEPFIKTYRFFYKAYRFSKREILNIK